MSRSPKYTSAQVVAARERELAERRRQREQERKQREAQARRQRQAAERAAIAADVAGLRVRVQDAAASVAAAGLGDRQARLLAALGTLATDTTAASTDATLRAARDKLGGLLHEADEVAVETAGILATRERSRAIAALRGSVAAAPDRADMDPAGAREVDRLLAQAGTLLADANGFANVQAQLTAAIREHLGRVQARRAALARMHEEADAARSAVAELLAEAAAAQVDLASAAAAEQLLAALASAVAASDVAGAGAHSARLRQAGQELESEFDRALDQLDRAQLVFDAVARALPRAGFTVLADSYAAQGANVSIRAERADGSAVQLAVVPGQGNDVEIVYHADGTDFTVQQTADGEIARCDLTQEILERFHAELAAEDVAAGELRWSGKPTTRPDAREARSFPAQGNRSRRVP